MAFNKDDFLAALDTMSVMDLNDLVKAIEEIRRVAAAMAHWPLAVQWQPLLKEDEFDVITAQLAKRALA